MAKKPTKRKGTRAKPAKPPRPREISPKAYNAVAGAAKLTFIMLLKSDFEVHPEYFQMQAEKQFSQKLMFGSEVDDPIYDKKKGSAAAEFTWILYQKVSRKKVLKLTVKYLIAYNNLEGQNAEAVCAFVKKLGKFATYPYFRAHASQLSWESGAELPILPIIHT